MKKFAKILLLLFVVGFCFTETSNNSVHAAGKTTYIIPQSMDFSGPYSDVSTFSVPSQKAFYMWWNENVGNKLGVKLQVKFYDTRYDPAVVASLWPGILSKDAPVAYGGFGGPDVVTLQDRLSSDKVPLYGSSGGYGFMWNPNLWVFNLRPTFVHEFAGFMNWVKTWWKEDRPIRVAAISNPGIPALEDAAKGYESVCNQLGNIQYIGTTHIKRSPVSIVSEMKRMVDRGNPDFIVMLISSTAEVVTAVKAQNQLGIRIPLILSAQNDISLVNNVLPLSDLEGRVYDVTTLTPSIDKNIEAYKIFQTYKSKITPPALDVEWNLNTLQMAGMATLITRAIERVVKKYGPEKVTGEKVYEAMYDGPFTSKEMHGLTFDLEYDKNSPFPLKTAKVKGTTVKNGKRVLFSDKWIDIPQVNKW